MSNTELIDRLTGSVLIKLNEIQKQTNHKKAKKTVDMTEKSSKQLSYRKLNENTNKIQ